MLPSPISYYWSPSISLKTTENLWFSEIFRVYRKRPVVWNGLKTCTLGNTLQDTKFLAIWLFFHKRTLYKQPGCFKWLLLTERFSESPDKNRSVKISPIAFFDGGNFFICRIANWQGCINPGFYPGPLSEVRTMVNPNTQRKKLNLRITQILTPFNISSGYH